MKTFTLVMVGFVFLTLTLRAQDQPVLRNDIDSATPPKALQWDDPKWWESMRGEAGGVPLGNSDYRVKGPLVDTFRVAPRSSGGGVGWNVLKWPVVSLFVPQPFPAPARGGRYLAWGESEKPWYVLAERADYGPTAWLSLSR